ncbi:FAD/NAD(P)-binding domain-containing protein [Piedraia hortae CBS 480.64]|uniref:FAD/NAD(P)-binding domain-containing protein n=1 Tax=Piedraia hortae CBS 480.64 TaxID=1314780 RepID=A0A6A7C0S6_9PEZI|nr:FAD/NAD(P)-binding domain-containing protein [Piedraia hortae CBS 480.64]
MDSQGESFDVIIVGAGISGINFAYRLQERLPGASYCILEGRHEIGGTWSLFKYPGIRSDSDLYTFGFPWRPWEEQISIAEGPKIIKYVKESARMYGIDHKIKFNHRVDKADFSTENKEWQFECTVSGEEKKTVRGKFLMICSGYYDYENPLQPVIPGLDNFQGKVIHPQSWPQEFDYSGKNIVIIGSGATAVTLLPSLAKKAKHVTILQRSPSYIFSQPQEDKLEKLIRALTWWNKGLQRRLVRFKWLLVQYIFSRACLHFPNFMRNTLGKLTKKQLPPAISPDPHFKPNYNPWEQRLCFCPDGDFYAALRNGSASIETDTISTVTPNSIKLTSGQELHPDVIVTATGLRMCFGGGINLSVDGEAFNVPEKYVWSGVMLEDLPNAAYVFGYVDASWTLGADATAQLITRMMKMMRERGTQIIVPRRTEREKSEMKEVPLVRLQSTYVAKAKSIMPKAGATGQWRPRSYFFHDILKAWYGDVESGIEWI